MPMVDNNCYKDLNLVIQHRTVSTFIEVVILVDKILEFFVIRRLMTLLALLKATTTLNFVQRRSIPMVPSDMEPSTSYGKGRLEKTLSQIHDTDDDVRFLGKHV
jgi:hypothetical protein